MIQTSSLHFRTGGQLSEVYCFFICCKNLSGGERGREYIKEILIHVSDVFENIWIEQTFLSGFKYILAG